MKTNKLKHSKFLKYLPLLFLALFWDCNNANKNGKAMSTPTSGNIHIAVDESLKPVITTEIQAFEAIYKNAHITADYVSEAASMQQFMNDSAVLVVLTRTLTNKEITTIKKQKIFPTQSKIGIGAIALITNKSNPDSIISMEDVRNIFKGTITQWDKLDSAKFTGKIQIVFANKNASAVRYLKDSVAGGTLSKNAYALDANEKVINFVSKNKNALGIIGVSWISDGTDSKELGFLKQIQVMAISKSYGEEAYMPYQAYIAQSTYPLNRSIYMISREAYSGLASGFMSFVAGSKGQSVVLKAGLVPATMPVRIVEINRN